MNPISSHGARFLLRSEEIPPNSTKRNPARTASGRRSSILCLVGCKPSVRLSGIQPILVTRSSLPLRSHVIPPNSTGTERRLTACGRRSVIPSFDACKSIVNFVVLISDSLHEAFRFAPFAFRSIFDSARRRRNTTRTYGLRLENYRRSTSSDRRTVVRGSLSAPSSRVPPNFAGTERGRTASERRSLNSRGTAATYRPLADSNPRKERMKLAFGFTLMKFRPTPQEQNAHVRPPGVAVSFPLWTAASVRCGRPQARSRARARGKFL